MTTCRLQINCERCCDDKCGHHQLQPASFFNSTRWLLLLSHCNFFFPSSLLNLRTCTSLSQYHITLWCVRWWCSKRRRMLIGSVPPVGLLLCGHSLHPPHSFIQSLSHSPLNVLVPPVGLLLCGHSLHPPHSFNHSLTRRSTFWRESQTAQQFGLF